MIDAGIENPESQEGKDFCIYKCPYARCIVFDDLRPRTKKRLARAVESKRLWTEGYSIREIAEKLNIGHRSIERDLSGRLD